MIVRKAVTVGSWAVAALVAALMAAALAAPAAFAGELAGAGTLGLVAQEDDLIASGVSGTCSWSIDADGNLVIEPLDGVSGKLEKLEDRDCFPWGQEEYRDQISSAAFKGTVSADSCSYMFADCSSLSSLDLSGLDTSKATDMEGMFSNCLSLAALDLSGLDTSSVTSMRAMFSSCSSLESLGLSGLDTSKVTDMDSMFSGCSRLDALDLSSFDTSKVTGMGSMFYACWSLSSLDLSSFDTSSVTDMSYMFSSCSLKSLDLSTFDTSSVTDMRSMFSGGLSLPALDLSSFDTSSVTDMSYMFSGCSLKSLDLSGFDTSKVTDMNCMFGWCWHLESLDLSAFDTSSVTDMSYMFRSCSSLASVDLSSFDTSNVASMVGMFEDCAALTSLDLSGFDLSGLDDTARFGGPESDRYVQSAMWMFAGCPSLARVSLGEKATKPIPLPSDEVNGHEDWFCESEGALFTSEEIADSRLGIACTYEKKVLDIARASVAASERVEGDAQVEPELEVTFGGKKLERGRDYAVVCSGGADAGTVAYEVVGVNGYSGSISGTAAASPGPTSLYKLVNASTGVCLIETSAEERDRMIAAGWEDEGVLCRVPGWSGEPVYRVRDPYWSLEWLTSDAGERDGLLSQGWEHEGLGWGSGYDDGVPRLFSSVCWFSDEGGAVPVYAVVEPNSLAQYFTADEDEYDYLVSLGCSGLGVKWYGSGEGDAPDRSRWLVPDLGRGHATVWAADQAYTGAPAEPEVTVTYGGKVLPKDDYTVSYSDNAGVGTATVTVMGTGDYKGTATGTFEIATAQGGESGALVDGTTGVSAKGGTVSEKASDGNSVRLTVSEPEGAALEEAAEEAREAAVASGAESVEVFDVALDVVDASGALVEGLTEGLDIELAFPVGSQYDGRTATVVQVHGGEAMPAKEAAVAGGVVRVSTDRLSQFVVSVAAAEGEADAELVAVYKLYDPDGKEWLYTTDPEGDLKLYAAEGKWANEGVAWWAPAHSETPMYRLFNPYANAHHYTTDKDERDALVSVGWNPEGIGWYCWNSDDAGGVPVYRLYNPYSQVHYYTTSAYERDELVAGGVWQYEGIGWRTAKAGDSAGGPLAHSAEVCAVEVTGSGFSYDGAEHRPSVTVVTGSEKAALGPSGDDRFTVSYSGNVNAGTATVRVEGKGGYAGAAEATFEIAPASIAAASVMLSPTLYAYDGEAKEPAVTVRLGSRTLAQGDDYTVAYSGNTAVGTATATVTGKGNYAGTAAATFAIAAAQPPAPDSGSGGSQAGGSAGSGADKGSGAASGGGASGSGGSSGSSSSGASQPAAPAAQPQAMHRLYNPHSGEHFYTADEGERDAVAAAGWKYEGIGWTAPETSNTPVYRLYNKYGGEHHYCTDKGEHDALVAAGWADEGIGWYSDDAKSVPLYREYNPNAFANNHNYTTSKEEHEWLLSLGWKDEGRAWYGVK